MAQPQATSAAPARTPAPVMSADGADWLVRPGRDAQQQPERVIRALHVAPGSTVADVGAGVGYFTWRLAQAVGPRGEVYAEDIQPRMIELLERNLKERHIRNVHEILGTETDPHLPDHRMDLILLVDVYHEFSHPQQMLERLRQSLANHGRLVLIEYRGEDPNVPIQALHKMTVAQVLSELQPAGFRLVQRMEFLPEQHILVFETK